MCEAYFDDWIEYERADGVIVRQPDTDTEFIDIGQGMIHIRTAEEMELIRRWRDTPTEWVLVGALGTNG